MKFAEFSIFFPNAINTFNRIYAEDVYVLHIRVIGISEIQCFSISHLYFETIYGVLSNCGNMWDMKRAETKK